MRLVNPDYDISFLDNDFKISILNNAGFNFMSLGIYEPAEIFFKAALEANKIRFNKDHEKNIKTLSNLLLL